MINSEQEKAFVRELMELEKKHGVYVVGCGCCGSPWVDDRESAKEGELEALRQEITNAS